MYHFVFLMLHLVAVLFFAVALFVTIPAHLIYALMDSRMRAKAPSPVTHVTCPACAELVLREARVCKHCGGALVPSGPPTSALCPWCQQPLSPPGMPSRRAHCPYSGCRRAIAWTSEGMAVKRGLPEEPKPAAEAAKAKPVVKPPWEK